MSRLFFTKGHRNMSENKNITLNRKQAQQLAISFIDEIDPFVKKNLKEFEEFLQSENPEIERKGGVD